MSESVATGAGSDAPGSSAAKDPVGRAFELYRETTRSRSAIALVAANLIPLLGVAFFGWSLWTILVLYWVENGIVGFWSVPKILLAEGSVISGIQGLGALATAASAGVGLGMPRVARGAIATFFLVHYGVFWLGHGLFVFLLPTFLGATSGTDLGGLSIDPSTGAPVFVPAVQAAGGFGEIVWSSVGIGAIALFLSHGASFLFTYLGDGAFRRTSPIAQMAAPYGRVVVLHLTILFGAFAITLIGAPIAALVVLVILKTALDLRFHLASHRLATASPDPSSAVGPADREGRAVDG
jgi:hypothetical protein